MRPEHDQPRPRPRPADRAVAAETCPRPTAGRDPGLACGRPRPTSLASSSGSSAPRSSRGASSTSATSRPTTRPTTPSRPTRCTAASGRCGTPRATRASRSCWPIPSTSRCSCSRGARAPLGIGAALHLLLALAGGAGSRAASGWGPGARGSPGAVYGLGGFVLSTVSLVQLFQAAAWAPWVIAALLAAVRRPGRPAGGGPRGARRPAGQHAGRGDRAPDRGGRPRPPRRPGALRAIAGGCASSAPERSPSPCALAAPALLGRGRSLDGLGAGAGLRRPGGARVLPAPGGRWARSLLPKFLGDPHAFSDADYWGRAYFPEGYPYLLSIYVGLPALLLAVSARGRRGCGALAAAGVVLSLGAYGPLGLAAGLDPLALPRPAEARLPGSPRGRPARRASGSSAALRSATPAGAGSCSSCPAWRGSCSCWRFGWTRGRPGGALRPSWPPLADPRGLVAARDLWPDAWLPSPPSRSRRAWPWRAAGAWAAHGGPGLVALDLAIVNGGINPLAPASFYDLRPEVAALVRARPREEGPSAGSPTGWRYTPGLRFSPSSPARPRTSGSTTSTASRCSRGRRCSTAGRGRSTSTGRARRRRGDPPGGRGRTPGASRATTGACSWPTSAGSYPSARCPDLAVARGDVKLPEIESPLGLYELRAALPRALGPYASSRPGAESRLEVSPSSPRVVILRAPRWPRRTRRLQVAYESVDPHTVRVARRHSPGFLVVLDGYHPDWRAEDRSGPVPLRVAFGRYRAIPTAGGETVRHAPVPARLARARPAAVRDGGAGRAGAGAPAVAPSVSHFTKPRACDVLFSARRRMNDRDPDTLVATIRLDTFRPQG